MSVQDLNWNVMWQEALNNSSLEWWKDSVGFWSKRAKGFSKMPRQDWRAKKVIDRLSIDPEYTILDVGAGSGIMAVPFAEYAKYVTAIEPSENMMESLKIRVESENLNNVSFIQKKWEDVILNKDFEEHDIVIASYSMAMFDMQDALLKMHNTAREGVCIFTFAGGIAGSRNYKDLWRLLYGKEFKGSPDYIYIYNILYQMGIFANVNIETGLLKQQYENFEQAVNKWQDTFNLHTPESSKIISDYLKTTLIEDDGKYSLIQETCNAMIWWKKK